MEFEHMLASRYSRTNQEEIDFLKSMDQAFAALIRTGRLHDAINNIEQGIKLRIDLYGSENQNVIEYAKSNIEKLCKKIIDFYQQEPEYAVTLFKQIEEIIKAKFLWAEELNQILVDIYNNIACFYRKLNKYRLAMMHLQNALENGTNPIQIAQTHLNICSIQSQMGKHKEAQEQSIQAMNLIQDQLILIKQLEDYTQSEEYVKMMQILAVSYHNIAVEFEYQKK